MTTKAPTHIVYVVSGDGEKKRWLEVGAAWRHKDSDGLNVILDALPANARLVLRPAKPSSAGGPK